MRICRLNRIKIKNPEKWDQANNDDEFIEDCFIESSEKPDSQRGNSDNLVYSEMDKLNNITESITLLTINEEVTIFEYAPKKFQEIREMDNIDRNKIKYSLSAKRNRD